MHEFINSVMVNQFNKAMKRTRMIRNTVLRKGICM